MSNTQSETHSEKGFTLIDAVAVLILLGILAAVAIPLGISAEEAKVQAEFSTLKGHLRYAQYLAMNDISPIQWGLEIGGSSYELVKYDNGAKTAHTRLLLGESSATHSFENGVTATGAASVLFDDWGSPGTADLSVALNGMTITIAANTGFIPL